jgi:hypothetical protein
MLSWYFLIFEEILHYSSYNEKRNYIIKSTKFNSHQQYFVVIKTKSQGGKIWKKWQMRIMLSCVPEINSF